jgi:hypothetical protein
MTVPDWLAKRGGTLTPGVEGSVFVVFDGEPQYRLDPVPVAGKVGCAVTETVSGRRLDDGTTHEAEPAALAGGLEQLRNQLGW